MSTINKSYSGRRGHFLWMLLMSAVLLFSDFASAQDERSALLEFFRGINVTRDSCLSTTWTTYFSTKDGQSVTKAEDGNNCPRSFCRVTCGPNGAVVGLNLAGLGLEGSIRPHSLSNLRMLSILDLSDNHLSGTLPEDLGALSSLRALDLSQNAFSGSIPYSFGGLHSLVNLSVADNQFQGSIPSSLGALDHLESLNLSSNFFHDTVPLELSQLTNIRNLDLHNNQLTGGIDPSFLGLPSLTFVDVSNNKLSGFLPWQPNDTLPLLQTLQYVNLSHNQFIGPLAPSKFSSVFAEKLRVLDMSYNQLSGNLPDFEFVIGLVTLRLNNNLFTGSVPSTLLSANLGLLQELDLSNNNLTGGIDKVLSTSLSILNLSHNSLSGEIPEKIGSCSLVDLSHNEFSGDLSSMQYWSDMLKVLDLSFNLLSGTLNNELSQLVRLQSLNISHNSLFGPISATYGLLPKLSSIDLSVNQLNGTIPSSMLNSSTIVYLNLSNNELTGTIPLQSTLSYSAVLSYPPSDNLASPIETQFPQMSLLDLSVNKLEGNISEAIGSFQNLKVLNLSNNNLAGPMPKALCNLTYLQMLDLSDNGLTGPIPDALPSTLTVLHLAYNHLSGIIPENLKRFPKSSFFPGNDDLVAPSDFASGPGGSIEMSKRKNALSKGAKAGIIGSSIAGLILILVIAMLFFSSRLRRSGEYREGSEFSANGGGIWRTCAAPFSCHASHVSHICAGTSSSDVLLRESDAKVPTTFGHKGYSTGLVSSWEPALKPEMDISASRPRNFLPGSGLHQDPLASAEMMDTPVVLKVHSPDRLSGDLHFLDKTLRFSAEELSRAPAEVLGRSSHGTTYKATLDNGHVLTVKWLREGLARNKKEFAREAKKFVKVRHPNLNPLRGYYWGPREHEKLILSDYVSSGSLAAHFADQMGQTYAPLSWKQRMVIAVDISRGLLYLHEEKHQAHGNLKASNVLIDDGSNPNARLTDYGLHLIMTPEGTSNQILNAGALGYRAPELAIMPSPKPTMKGDIYAFGVIMLELVTGKSAGDIISGQSGAVDLTDWVRLLNSEGRVLDSCDPVLVDMGGQHFVPPRGMEEMVALALKCISPQMAERPTIGMIYEELTSLAL